MIQDLKTLMIVVSATLAALFVHQLLEQAQAVAARGGDIRVQEDRLPVFVN